MVHPGDRPAIRRTPGRDGAVAPTGAWVSCRSRWAVDRDRL